MFFQNYINHIQYIVLHILFRTLLKVSCSSRTIEVGDRLVALSYPCCRIHMFCSRKIRKTLYVTDTLTWQSREELEAEEFALV